jgi:hypothetical protein
MAKRKPANKGKKCVRRQYVMSASTGKRIKVCAKYGKKSSK